MRRLARYIVEDTPIAKGGMGQIFRGKDEFGKVVAIKEILPEFAADFSILSRIEKEVDFLLKVDHPAIVKLESAFRDDRTQSYYIVMELVDGENVEQYVQRNGPIPFEQACELLAKILDALQCVHDAHIVHRDIKPSNIMIRKNGGVCLLDFGVAKDMETPGGMTLAGSVIGTTGYMSPEQAEGYSINYRSDLYSLGCVFYYMLTGHHAYNTLASEFETKDNIINNDFPRLSKYKKGLPDWLQTVLDKATDKNMMKRYGSCMEWLSDLRNGTHISVSASSAPVKISLGREMCDMIYNDPGRKISRHHADIELKAFTGGRYYVFSDCSANGTFVNGKRIQNSAVQIKYGGPYPDIYLAGVREGRLNWPAVVAELDKRYKAKAEEEKSKEDASKTLLDVTGFEQSSDSESPRPENFRVKAEDAGEEATGTLVAAFIFSAMGGLIGIWLGSKVANEKIYVDGTKRHRYKKSHRRLGVVAMVLGAVVALGSIIISRLA